MVKDGQHCIMLLCGAICQLLMSSWSLEGQSFFWRKTYWAALQSILQQCRTK